MPKPKLMKPVITAIFSCTLSSREAVNEIKELIRQAMQTMPKMTPTPKTKINTKPNITESTVVNMTSIRAALPASPCTTPVKIDLGIRALDLALPTLAEDLPKSTLEPFLCQRKLTALPTSGLNTSNPRTMSINPAAN